MDTPTPENIAQTVRDLVARNGDTEILCGGPTAGIETPTLLSVPAGRTVQDVTQTFRSALEHLTPSRRKGTSEVYTLESLIAWADRFKGDGSLAALFAVPKLAEPSLTCVANWHAEGGANPLGIDETAQHGDHRAVYRFPVSIEWQRWTGLAGKSLSKDELAEFLNLNIKDVVAPTPAMLGQGEPAEDWERQMIEIAALVDGRFASPRRLMELSRTFSATEATEFKHVRDRSSGEGMVIEATNHVDAAGDRVQIPNLFVIGIPVFDGGQSYPLAVQLLFTLRGGLKFRVEVHDPETAFRHAFTRAAETARDQTGLPLLYGRPTGA